MISRVEAQISFISQGQNGKLAYGTDQQGNRIPDFSHCGYGGGDYAIPNVPARIVLSPVDGDNTEQIQTALDYVASLPADSTGIRGAVLLRPGNYSVFGSLKIMFSGVILRGSGMGKDGTCLIAAGTDRRTLLRIAGKDDRKWPSGTPRNIIDEYVPVGSSSFRLDNAEGLKAGDTVCINRPCTQEWIDQLGMNSFGGGLNGYFAWKPSTRDILWDRVITAVEENRITVDAPLTMSIDVAYGGATLQAYNWLGRICQVGVENICLQSEYNSENVKDEDHSWFAITFENTEDAWVRQCTFRHFAGSAVSVWESCRRITTEDCLSLAPISENGGYRRHTFFTMGQQCLFLRCWSEQGRHDFSVGHCVAGPNAFVQCESYLSLNDSGPIESLACGVLYDNVRIDGEALRLCDRGSRSVGIGWSAANCILWQCQAATIECEKPPTAWNWAFGCWGEYEGDGYWNESNSYISPYSLYAEQLKQRLGSKVPTVPIMKVNTSRTTSPSVELAAELTTLTRNPAETLRDFIQKASERNPVLTNADGAKALDDILDKPMPVSSDRISTKKITLKNGKIICDDQLLIGSSTGVAWWRGNIRPDVVASYGLGVTRFVPGRIGPGYTDDLDVLTDTMVKNGQAVLEHNYGLWYDRRRDDHQRVRRADGDVRPPFYEQPFARSGTGTAWDGLSQYDLTKYNLWYWKRLQDFAGLCDEKGLVLLHHNFFQHNVLEAGAHWVDFPWRTANNINQTGFPEPPYFAGDKRIFIDELFYDTSHPARTALYRAYIEKCLDNFTENTNVIQMIGEEYTGPSEFMQFWLDTIIQWEKKSDKSALVGLSCTKDVQDEILSDSVRSKAVSIIDIRYWWYQSDGRAYAPQGGKHLAPRQHSRVMHPKNTSFSQVIRAIREYRERCPDKAVIFSADRSYGWAELLGGGSIPNLPASTDRELLRAVVHMKPYDLPDNSEGQYAMVKPGEDYLIYAEKGQTVSLDLKDVKGSFKVYSVNLRTGLTADTNQLLAGGTNHSIKLTKTPYLLWVRRVTTNSNN